VFGLPVPDGMDAFTDRSAGFPGRLLSILLPQLIRAREARDVIHRVSQPHTRSERYWLRRSTVTQSDRPILRHDECLHHIHLLLCTLHVYLGPGTLDSRALRLDDFLQSFCRWSAVTLLGDCSDHHLRYVEDGSFFRDCERGYWSRRSDRLACLWYYDHVEWRLIYWCAGFLGECIGGWRIDHTGCARSEEEAETGRRLGEDVRVAHRNSVSSFILLVFCYCNLDFMRIASYMDAFFPTVPLLWPFFDASLRLGPGVFYL